MLLELAADLRVVTRGPSAGVERLRRFARDHGLTVVVVDLEDEDEDEDDATALLADLGVTEDDLPVAVWRSEQVLRDPTDAELAALVQTPHPVVQEDT
jgi:hypothetical protein